MTSKERLMTIADQQEECGRIVTAFHIRHSLAELLADRDRAQKALDHAMKGDMDPEDRVVIAQILAAVGTTGGRM